MNTDPLRARLHDRERSAHVCLLPNRQEKRALNLRLRQKKRRTNCDSIWRNFEVSCDSRTKKKKGEIAREAWRHAPSPNYIYRMSYKILSAKRSLLQKQVDRYTNRLFNIVLLYLFIFICKSIMLLLVLYIEGHSLYQRS